MNKALITVGTGPFEEVLAASLPTFRAFAKRHGYTIVFGNEEHAKGRNPSWARVPMFEKYLGVFDEVLWLDADCVILDDSEDVPLPDDCWQAMLDSFLGPNVGVWKMRACAKSRCFLTSVWAEGEPWAHEMWWDNSAALKVFGYDMDLFFQVPAVLSKQPSGFDSGTHWLGDEWNTIVMPWGARADRPEGPPPHMANPRIRHYGGLPPPVRAAGIRADVAALG